MCNGRPCDLMLGLDAQLESPRRRRNPIARQWPMTGNPNVRRGIWFLDRTAVVRFAFTTAEEVL